MNSRARSGLVAIGCAVTAACGASQPADDAVLSVLQTDSAGVRIATMQRSLDFRERGLRTETLAANLRIGGIQVFGHIADVTGLRGGRFAVLDRLDHSVKIFDQHGVLSSAFGRKGKGPGEFIDPFALEGFGNHFVVRDASRRTPLIILDSIGRFQSAAGAALPADWNATVTRMVIPRTTDAPFRMPAEDHTRRLVALNDTQFAYVSQPPVTTSAEGTGALAFLVRFNLRGEVIDTIASGSAPPDEAVTYRGSTIRHVRQPWYAGRPMWAAGNAWIAQGHGDSSAISIRDNYGNVMAIIRVPSERTPIRPVDKSDFAEWFYSEDVLKHGSTENISMLQRLLGRRQLKAYTREIVSAMAWADRAPSITAMYGDGNCLWLSGFAPAEFPTGVSQTWIRVNVATMRTEAFRMPRAGGRVRDVREGSMYVTYQDDDGSNWLERYEAGCPR